MTVKSWRSTIFGISNVRWNRSDDKWVDAKGGVLAAFIVIPERPKCVWQKYAACEESSEGRSREDRENTEKDGESFCLLSRSRVARLG